MDTSVIDLKAQGKIPPLKHFKCIDPAVRIAPFVEELARNESAFAYDSLRQKTLKVHAETEAVSLRKRASS